MQLLQLIIRKYYMNMNKILSHQSESFEQKKLPFFTLVKLLLTPNLAIFTVNFLLNIQNFYERLEQSHTLVFGAAYGESEFNRLIESTGDNHYIGLGRSCGDHQKLPFNPLTGDWNDDEWLENVKLVLGKKKFNTIYVDRCAAYQISTKKIFWDANKLGVPTQRCYQFIGTEFDISSKEDQRNYGERYYIFGSPTLKPQFLELFKLFLVEDRTVEFHPYYYEDTNHYIEQKNGYLKPVKGNQTIVAAESDNLKVVLHMD